MSWIRAILDFAAEYAVQLTLILISFSVIVAFRYRILYTEYTYDGQRPDNWDKNISLGDYIEGLLANPRTRKKKLREYLVNDIYLTEIGGETISLKKMKPATTIFRIFLRVVSRFSLWFRHIEVLRPNDAFDIYATEETKRFIDSETIFFEQNHVQVLVRSRDPNFKNLNEKLMDAILRNIPECKVKAADLSNESRPEVFEKITKLVVQFLRGAGYLYTRRLVTKETDWDNAMFFWTVVAIGLNLDPILFPVRIHLTQTSSSFTFPIPKPDLIIFEYRTNAFITVEQTAKSQLRVAKEKIRNARAKVQAHLARASSQPDSFERTDRLIESLAEENTADALPPEAFARDSDIAQVFLKSIKTLTGLSINGALKHPLIITCNKFIKVSSKKNLSDFYTPLERQITAMKLGLVTSFIFLKTKVKTPSHFDQNPGFEEFAKQTHLHRYLYVQGHELEVDSSNRILVMFEGRELPWEEVLPKLEFEKLSGVFSGQYSKEGFVNYGVYDWTEFEPFYIEKQLPPPWGDRYLCEVCSWIIDKPRIKGDHTFLRLKTPKGEWYSVGQYEPLKPSRFMSPDVSEYWNGHFTTLAFEITQEQFSLMKQKIEEDKRQQLYPYQVYQSNCTIWAKSITEVAGLNLPSSLAAVDLLTPGLAAFGRKINGLGLTPEWVKNMVKLTFAVLHNCLGLVLGSGMVHPNFKSDPDLNSSVPYIHSLRDLFDIKKAVSEHPFVLGNYVRNQVEEWRNYEKQKLMATKEELISKLSSVDDGDKESLQAQLDEVTLSLDSIQYAVPPEFKS